MMRMTLTMMVRYAAMTAASSVQAISRSGLPIPHTVTTYRFFNGKMYLSQILKYICLKFLNVFVSNWKIYLSQIANPSHSHNLQVFSIGKCICLKCLNIFVSNFWIYLSQILKYICLKLENVVVSNFQFLVRSQL